MADYQHEELEDYRLVTAVVTRDDVNQEAALVELATGRRVSKYLIRQRLLSAHRELLFGELSPGAEASLPWEPRPVNPTAIEHLVDWALSQTEATQDLIWGFLENPEDSLTDTVSALKKMGIISTKKVHVTKESSIADVLLANLPASRDELISLVQEISPSTRRPAATVRQFLRRMERSNKITIQDNVVARRDR